MVRLFQQAIRPPDPPAHSGGGEHHGGPETTAGGEHNHADSGGPGEHSSSDDTDLGVHEDPQGTETGTDLADRASAGLRDHPGLLENIRSNTNSAVDVRIVVCQAAKESNYAKLSETPRAFVNRYKSGSVGADGEIGLLQIMPSTGKRYGASVDQLKAVGTNVKVATNYLVHIKNRFAIDMRTTLAVYNWGEGHYQKFVDGKIKQIYPGSLSYADKILDCSRRVVLPGDASSPHKIFK